MRTRARPSSKSRFRQFQSLTQRKPMPVSAFSGQGNLSLIRRASGGLSQLPPRTSRFPSPASAEVHCHTLPAMSNSPHGVAPAGPTGEVAAQPSFCALSNPSSLLPCLEVLPIFSQGFRTVHVTVICMRAIWWRFSPRILFFRISACSCILPFGGRRQSSAHPRAKSSSLFQVTQLIGCDNRPFFQAHRFIASSREAGSIEQAFAFAHFT